MPVPSTQTLRAFAKINCGLRVLAKRPDGFHEIRTIYQTIRLHDLVLLHLSASGSHVQVECDVAWAPSGNTNLVYRACQLWKRARRWRGSIRAEITKRIPAGSGLGGASTDAAAAIEGLENLTGNQLSLAARYRLAAALGSDVPLFLWGGRVLGCGRGEEVYPLADLPAVPCLLVYPGFPISTAEAYRQVGQRLTNSAQAVSISNFGVWSQIPRQGWGPAENDFEAVAFAMWPELARLKRRLFRAGAETASLTGSGSALYALFSSSRQLRHAQSLAPQGWRTFLTRTLPRSAYRRLTVAA